VSTSLQVDITEGIQKACTVLWCKECNRWLNVRPGQACVRRRLMRLPQPPKAWVRADLESKELLTFCVKKVKGLAKVKLVDAAFIWTEPHSRRLKLKLTVQAEVLNGAILQQTFVVEARGGGPRAEPVTALRRRRLTQLCSLWWSRTCASSASAATPTAKCGPPACRRGGRAGSWPRRG